MTDCDAVTLEDWLFKKSKYIGSWRRRWTVLTSKSINTYKRKHDYKNQTETIILSEIESIESKTENIFCVKSMKKIIQFRTANKSQKIKWMKTIEDQRNIILIPINIICESDESYCCSFIMQALYDSHPHEIIEEIMNTLNEKHKTNGTHFVVTKMTSDSYLQHQVLINHNQRQNDALRFDNYSRETVTQKGIYLVIDIAKPNITHKHLVERRRTSHKALFDKIKNLNPIQINIAFGFIRSSQNTIPSIPSIPNEVVLIIAVMIDESGQCDIDDFELLRVCSGWGFSKTLLVRKKDTKNLFLMQCFRKKRILQRNQVENIQKARRVLGGLNHPFIISLYYAFQTEQKLFMVLSYCGGGELFFHLGKAGRLTEETSKFYVAEIVLGIGYMHSMNILYRNLKPENVLLDNEGHVKLSDFMLSSENVDDKHLVYDFCGTPEYLAPEILRKCGHGLPIDWWSLGALTYEMLTGMPPFYSRDRDRLFEKILRSKIRFASYMSDKSRDFIKALLQRNWKLRLGSKMGMVEIQKHSFLNDINWKCVINREMIPPFIPTKGRNYFDEPSCGMPIGTPSVDGKYAYFDGFSFDTGIYI